MKRSRSEVRALVYVITEVVWDGTPEGIKEILDAWDELVCNRAGISPDEIRLEDVNGNTLDSIEYGPTT